MKEFSILSQITKMKNYYDKDVYCLIDIALTINGLTIGYFKLSNIEEILSIRVLVFVTNYTLTVYDRGKVYWMDSKREFKKDS